MEGVIGEDKSSVTNEANATKPNWVAAVIPNICTLILLNQYLLQTLAIADNLGNVVAFRAFNTYVVTEGVAAADDIVPIKSTPVTRPSDPGCLGGTNAWDTMGRDISSASGASTTPEPAKLT